MARLNDGGFVTYSSGYHNIQTTDVDNGDPAAKTIQPLKKSFNAFGLREPYLKENGCRYRIELKDTVHGF